jgi:hypothetical protein
MASFEEFREVVKVVRQAEAMQLFGEDLPDDNEMRAHNQCLINLIAQASNFEALLSSSLFGDETDKHRFYRTKLHTIIHALRESLDLWHPTHPCERTILKNTLPAAA